MARPLRIEYAGGLYHVTSRGDRREDIYSDDEDRARFLEVLAGCVERFNWLIHAYCLMSNHYHLLIENYGDVRITVTELRNYGGITVTCNGGITVTCNGVTDLSLL